MDIMEQTIFVERYLTTIKDFEEILVGRPKEEFSAMTPEEKSCVMRRIELEQRGFSTGYGKTIIGHSAYDINYRIELEIRQKTDCWKTDALEWGDYLGRDGHFEIRIGERMCFLDFCKFGSEHRPDIWPTFTESQKRYMWEQLAGYGMVQYLDLADVIEQTFDELKHKQ